MNNRRIGRKTSPKKQVHRNLSRDEAREVCRLMDAADLTAWKLKYPLPES
jgi:hypothetical protein